MEFNDFLEALEDDVFEETPIDIEEFVTSKSFWDFHLCQTTSTP